MEISGEPERDSRRASTMWSPKNKKKTSCGRTQMRSNRAQSTKKRHLWRGKRKGKEKHSLRRGARRGLGTDLGGAWDRNRCFPSRPRRTAMRKRGWGRRSVPPRIGATVEVSERVFYMPKKKKNRNVPGTDSSLPALWSSVRRSYQ